MVDDETLLLTNLNLSGAKNAKYMKLSKQMLSTKPLTTSEEKLDEHVSSAELKLTGLIAVNNMPLIKDICPDSKIAERLAMKITKATQMIKHALGNTFLEVLYDKLKEAGSLLSLIMDETTDIGSKKQCTFTVIYVDKLTGSVQTSFFDMYEISSSKAKDLLSFMINSAKDKGIPIENMIVFSADTTNALVAQHLSVFSLKEKYPQVACIQCYYYKAHLSASKASLNLPYAIEDLIRNIGSHFSSFLRQESLREFQELY